MFSPENPHNSPPTLFPLPTLPLKIPHFPHRECHHKGREKEEQRRSGSAAAQRSSGAARAAARGSGQAGKKNDTLTPGHGPGRNGNQSPRARRGAAQQQQLVGSLDVWQKMLAEKASFHQKVIILSAKHQHYVRANQGDPPSAEDYAGRNG